MNRTKLKQIKSVVKNLKLVNTIEEYLSVETKTGGELLDAGLEFVGTTGEPINRRGTYRTKSVKIRALNHVDKVKDFYKLYGEKKTISKYLAWLDNHHQKMLLKYPSVFKPTTEPIIEPLNTEQ